VQYLITNIIYYLNPDICSNVSLMKLGMFLVELRVRGDLDALACIVLRN